jgi:3-hydroxyisobutyrate dehydrogenase-like beta-hydroxyacid dehydrogenase
VSVEIGFVGAGLMGAPMVRNLLAAGHAVTVSSRSPERLAGEGWTVVASPAEAAGGAGVVCSIVPDGPEVTEVVDSLLTTAAPGTVLIEMSTIDPDVARTLATRCAEHGVTYLDVPVSGGPAGAAAGTLAMWAGGDRAAFDRVRPVLDVLGDPEKVRWFGPVGSGLVVKLVNNLAAAVNLAAGAEVLAIARAAGIDPVGALDAVMGGSGGSWQLDRIARDRVLPGAYAPGFKLAHMVKDIRLARALAGTVGVTLPVADETADRYERALTAFGPDTDYSAVARLTGFDPTR